MYFYYYFLPLNNNRLNPHTNPYNNSVIKYYKGLYGDLSDRYLEVA